MSHIDEGRVAAYLDGQLPAGSGETVEIELHVAACVECRTLLEEALRHRDRARAILRTGAPGSSETPPFDQVLRRAGVKAGGGRHIGQRSPLATLAWAATIVLAVGASWYVVRNPSPVPGALGDPRSTAAAATGTDTFLPPKSTQVFARREDSTVGPSLLADVGASVGERAPAQVAQAEVASNVPGRVPAGAADSSPRANAALALAQPSPMPTAPAAPPAGQALAAGEARDKQEPPRADRLEQPGGLREPVAATGQVAGAERKLAEAPAAALAQRARAPGPDTWRETSQGGAMRALGRLPLQIPDLPVLGYYVRSSGEAMRVVQDLGQGQTIEIVQEKSAQDSLAKAASGEAARNEGAVNQVTDETGGYRTTIRGSVSLDSLSALLRKLR